MKDYLAQVEKLRKDAAAMFDRLASHLTVLADH
jgi:hypothetical protein